jgi:FKBP-type peptidyl-prolyl cis-trans isomerase (trigger factor)
VQERITAEATQSLARELALEAAAAKLGLDVTDDDLRAFIREQAEAENDDGDADVDKVVDQVMADGRAEQFRDDIRLREALDRIASEVKRIPLDLALAREKLWTPGQEKPAGAAKLWTPGQEETSA